MFGLTYIQFDIICLRILTDYHTGVNLFTRSDEECSTILCVEQTVSYSFTCLEGNQGSLASVLDISFIRSVAVKGCVHDTVTFCIGQEFSTITDQTS